VLPVPHGRTRTDGDAVARASHRTGQRLLRDRWVPGWAGPQRPIGACDDWSLAIDILMMLLCGTR
jgi:hypothetical protein